jgi:hypothetical protein
MVTTALAATVRVIDVVSKEYMRSTNLFLSAPDMGGSINLLHVLRAGVEVEVDRRARLERGEVSPQEVLAWWKEV